MAPSPLPPLPPLPPIGRSEPSATVLGDSVGGDALRRRGLARCGTHLGEGLLFAGVALLITSRWGGSMAGVFAIFLCSGALTSRLETLLTENREAIFSGDAAARASANRVTAVSVLATFAGVLLAFLVVPSLLQLDPALQFDFLLQAANIGEGSIVARRFGSLPGLLMHNAGVLGTGMLLCAIYRAFGLQIVLVWNAATWGVVLQLLVTRANEQIGAGAWYLAPATILAVLPHLAAEAAAYALGGLAAVFASKAVVKYRGPDTQLRSALLASSRLTLGALALLLVAALVESTWPEWWLSRLR